MKIDKLKTFKKILIVGYGLEGKTTEEFLKKYHPTAEISIADQKNGENYLSCQSEFDLAIKSPGVKKELITIPYTTATNIFFANTTQKKIGITGSKGKSTTVSLLDSVLREAGMPSKLYGNIGKPTLEYFMGEMKDEDIMVLELSSYQLDDIEYSPHIACFLNIYHDHDDYHGGFENYLAAKANIVKYSSPDDYFVYNGRVKEIAEIAQATSCKTIDFSKVDPSLPLRMTNGVGMTEGTESESVLAARAITRLLDVSNEVFESVVKSYSGLPHRLQTVGTFNDITFIDDSAATTPEAVIFALDSTPHVGSLILGGLDRGIEFGELAKKVSAKKVGTIILFPNADERMEKELLEANIDQTRIHHAKDMMEAVDLAFTHKAPGTVCLLSPGCASYNQYANFLERGERFKDAIYEKK